MISRQTILLILIALVCGGVAVYLANSYVTGEISEYKQSIDEQYATVDVVVAATNLLKGEELTTQNLQLRPVPKEFLHREAIRPSEVDSILGYQLVNPLGQGEPLLATHIQYSKINTFSSLIEPGQRAITFPVDPLSSISGMIAPGDYIDILATLKNGTEENTMPIITNIRVMATGVVTDQNRESSDRQDARYQTITLHVEPNIAANVAHARSVGDLTVTLRSRTDQEPLQQEAVTTRTLLGKTARRPVQIIKGGSSQ